MYFFCNLLLLPVVICYHVTVLPYDDGANIKGSSFAHNFLIPELSKKDTVTYANTDKHLRIVLVNGFVSIWNSLNMNEKSLLIGGDHTVAIPSIFASNEFCSKVVKKKLGVLWMGAHADFNTIGQSKTKNIHGTPVAVLCGHTLPFLSYGNKLDTDQFAYYGLRDVDTLEQNRLNDFSMNVLKSKNEIMEWVDNFEAIHISFDVDCLDPSIISANTPVKNGISLKEIEEIFESFSVTQKVISMDLVEWNPLEIKCNEKLIKEAKMLASLIEIVLDK